MDKKDSGLSLPFDANPQNNIDLFFAFATVPEPSSSAVFLLGGMIALLQRRRP